MTTIARDNWDAAYHRGHNVCIGMQLFAGAVSLCGIYNAFNSPELWEECIAGTVIGASIVTVVWMEFERKWLDRVDSLINQMDAFAAIMNDLRMELEHERRRHRQPFSLGSGTEDSASRLD